MRSALTQGSASGGAECGAAAGRVGAEERLPGPESGRLGPSSPHGSCVVVRVSPDLSRVCCEMKWKVLGRLTEAEFPSSQGRAGMALSTPAWSVPGTAEAWIKRKCPAMSSVNLPVNYVTRATKGHQVSNIPPPTYIAGQIAAPPTSTSVSKPRNL